MEIYANIFWALALLGCMDKPVFMPSLVQATTAPAVKLRAGARLCADMDQRPDGLGLWIAQPFLQKPKDFPDSQFEQATINPCLVFCVLLEEITGIRHGERHEP